MIIKVAGEYVPTVSPRPVGNRCGFIQTCFPKHVWFYPEHLHGALIFYFCYSSLSEGRKLNNRYLKNVLLFLDIFTIHTIN